MTPAGVSGIVTRVRRGMDGRVTVVAALWGIVLVGLVLVLAWLVAGPEGWAQGTWGPLFLDVLLLAVLGAGAASMVWLRRRWLVDSTIAKSLDEAAGLRPGTVLSSLEISRELPRGVSPGLAAFAEKSVVAKLDLPEERLSGSLRAEVGPWSRRALAGLALLTPLLVLFAALTPDRTLSAWGGLSSPVSLLVAPVLPPLTVEPGNAEVLRGAALDVSVGAPGREQVTLHWQTEGDVRRSSSAAVEGEGSASFHFAAVTATVRYWATTPDGARTPEFRVVPTDPLFVSDLQVELAFPPHTGRAPEEYRGDLPPLTVPVGTRFRIFGRASRPLQEAVLRLQGSERTEALEVVGAGFSSLWSPRQSGIYDWYFRDEAGAPAELGPRPLEVTLVQDSAPQVRFTYPARDTLLPMNLRQPLVLQVRDDYGLGSLELISYRVTSAGERREDVVQRMAVGGVKSAMARPVLDVSAWGLLPGDEVHYRARATDNAPSSQATAQRVEELAEQARQAAEATRDLQRQAGTQAGGEQRPRDPAQPPEDALAFQRREDVRQALEEQEALASAVDSLVAEMEDLQRAMEEAGLADLELQADLEELQELLQEMSSPEVQEQLEELSEGLESMDSREAQETLEQLMDAQEDFRRRLEESLETFRRAAVEQDFRATQAEAQELAREQQMLSEMMREGENPELRAQQQAGVENRAQEMEARMESLEQRLEEVSEPEAAQSVREAREQSAGSREQMSQAEQQARAQQMQEAAEQAAQAAEGMQQAADQLQQAQQQMSDELTDEARQAMQNAAEDALALARRQSEIQQQMEGATQQQMAELRGDVGALMQGLQNMSENLSETAGTDSEVQSQTEQAMQALKDELQAMQQQGSAGSQAAGAAEGAVQALNQLAMSAMAGAQGQSGSQPQGGQGGAGQQGQEGDGQQVMQRLGGLAQQQAQLNGQSGQLMGMRPGEQARRSQLQAIGQGQQQLAGELGRLVEQPGASGLLGDLEALEQEALELADRLAGGRLDPETRQRQERLFHRLLDAGRSLEKDEELSEERESRTAGEVAPRVVLPLSADAVGAVRYPLPDAAALQRLSPAERQLVLEYFERLNREGRELDQGPVLDAATVPPDNGAAP